MYIILVYIYFDKLKYYKTAFNFEGILKKIWHRRVDIRCSDK